LTIRVAAKTGLRVGPYRFGERLESAPRLPADGPSVARWKRAKRAKDAEGWEVLNRAGAPVLVVENAYGQGDQWQVWEVDRVEGIGSARQMTHRGFADSRDVGSSAPVALERYALRHGMISAADTSPKARAPKAVAPAKPKLPTFKQSASRMLDVLAAAGWKLGDRKLKVPYATSPDRRSKVWFKAQSVYEGSTRPTTSITGGFLDIRKPADFERTLSLIFKRAGTSPSASRRASPPPAPAPRPASIVPVEAPRRGFFAPITAGGLFSTGRKTPRASLTLTGPVDDLKRKAFMRNYALSESQVAGLTHEIADKAYLFKRSRGPFAKGTDPDVREHVLGLLRAKPATTPPASLREVVSAAELDRLYDQAVAKAGPFPNALGFMRRVPGSKYHRKPPAGSTDRGPSEAELRAARFDFSVALRREAWPGHGKKAKKTEPTKPEALPRRKKTDPLLKIRLKPESAKQQARRLARSRAHALRAKDREQLAKIRAELREAQRRRKAAMKRAVELCRRGRSTVRQKVKAYREQERERINAQVAAYRQKARTQCQMRKARIRRAGATTLESKRRHLAEERKLQAQLRRYEAAAKKKRETLKTKREERAESDDAVRSNLPPELAAVFDKVKKTVRGGPRRTRTEAFLEWAAENPQEVIALQQHETDREVKRLLAERSALEARLAKTGAYEPSSEEMRHLERLGLSQTQVEAQKHARDLRWGADAPF